MSGALAAVYVVVPKYSTISYFALDVENRARKKHTNNTLHASGLIAYHSFHAWVIACLGIISPSRKKRKPRPLSSLKGKFIIICDKWRAMHFFRWFTAKTIGPGNFWDLLMNRFWYFRRTGKIRTWKLAYTPSNDKLAEMMSKVIESLKLDGFVRVQSPDDMADVLFEHGLIAGIEFHHPSVRKLQVLRCWLAFFHNISNILPPQTDYRGTPKEAWVLAAISKRFAYRLWHVDDGPTIYWSFAQWSKQRWWCTALHRWRFQCHSKCDREGFRASQPKMAASILATIPDTSKNHYVEAVVF